MTGLDRTDLRPDPLEKHDVGFIDGTRILERLPVHALAKARRRSHPLDAEQAQIALDDVPMTDSPTPSQCLEL